MFVSDVSGGGASNLLGFGGLPRLGGGFPGLGGVGGGIGGEGGGGLPMLGGYLKLAESFKEGEFGLRSTAVMWDSMFMESTSALTNNTSAYRSMFNSSINGLLGSANTFSNIFSSFLGSLSSILSSISGGGGGGGFLDILGGLPIIGSVVKGIQGFGSLTGLFGGGAAAAADVAGVTSMFSALPPVFGIYHQGGVIYAHRGWPRLHSDDVPIIAQTGERVLSRAQNRDYEAGKGGSPQHQTLNFTFVTPAGQVLEKHEMRQIMGEVKSGLKHKTIRVPKTKSALRKW